MFQFSASIEYVESSFGAHSLNVQMVCFRAEMSFVVQGRQIESVVDSVPRGFPKESFKSVARSAPAVPAAAVVHYAI